MSLSFTITTIIEASPTHVFSSFNVLAQITWFYVLKYLLIITSKTPEFGETSIK